MPLDGYTLSFLSRETRDLLIGSRVDKIYQMDNYSLILHLRKSGENHKLFISCHPQTGRFCLTGIKYENPETPPMFCMVLRKYLEGSRLADICQIGMERIVHFVFDSVNEIGDHVNKILIGEFMGKHSNLVLIDEKEKMIHDSIHRFALSENSFREIIPGRRYQDPPAQDKIAMGQASAEFLQRSFIDSYLDSKIEKAVLSVVSGVSPVLSREICLRSDLVPDELADTLGSIDYQKLEKTLSILEEMRDREDQEYYLVKENDRFIDFTPLKYEIYHHLENIPYKSINTLIDDFVGGRDRINKMRQQKEHLLKVLEKEILRLEKRFDLNQQKIRDHKNAEKYRIYGDLLTANLYQLAQGKEATVIDYFSEEQNTLTIPLDEQLTPNQNAQRYYKKYNKAKAGAESAREQLAIIKEEIDYLESIGVSIENSSSPRDLEEIRNEMTESGYLKKDTAPKKKKKPDKIPAIEKIDYQDFEIYIGHNNKQNDYLTTKLGSSSDLWLHVKDIPGSHVLVRNPNRKEIPFPVLEKAALLAARNSKAKNANIVSVDYTLKKHVKKPKGAKPGFVLYDHAETIQVRLQ